ncbi:hypothetical protein [Falsiroseomonas stagni]|uniref:DUF5591 domain-containing protein n=1 Tax=Falsiroseomonas stagni DSM 19981 TaxID=1123062 RepID=A0A1I3XDP3_9PROT|nr:hypothetical protein [Falsiroseomonas stagni]SFK17658.1 hypothetical protein SAMN02745775_101212 [Falsiroseomonas stagni DSM 19981]
MVTTDDRATRVRESAQKFRAPFTLEPSLALYCPQDNVDSLAHPRIRAWFDFVGRDYNPVLPDAPRRVLLLLPCTRTKPYILSTEHRRINAALIAAGFVPMAPADPTLLALREEGESEALFSLAPLLHPDGIVVHRAVISEPLGLVPYEHMLAYPGGVSPAVLYDDPGLFEERGNAVSPWRADHTAVRVSATRWKWGPAEKRAYVVMHNEMARVVAEALARFGGVYTRRISWVAPGLTHRSFVVAKGERAAHGIVAQRQVGAERLPLVGANDLLPADLRLTALPTRDQCQDGLSRLAVRLGKTPAEAAGHFGRGGGDATPLALPELLADLLTALRAH